MWVVVGRAGSSGRPAKPRSSDSILWSSRVASSRWRSKVWGSVAGRRLKGARTSFSTTSSGIGAGSRGPAPAGSTLVSASATAENKTRHACRRVIRVPPLSDRKDDRAFAQAAARHGFAPAAGHVPLDAPCATERVQAQVEGEPGEPVPGEKEEAAGSGVGDSAKRHPAVQHRGDGTLAVGTKPDDRELVVPHRHGPATAEAVRGHDYEVEVTREAHQLARRGRAGSCDRHVSPPPCS